MHLWRLEKLKSAGLPAAAAAATASVSAAAASAAAQEVTTEVAQAAQDAIEMHVRLDALEVEAAANNTFDVFRATAAIRQIQSGNEQ